jgi:hypothetical protein
MTKNEAREIIAAPVVGYWSALGGIEVKKIVNGFEDYAEIVECAWTRNKRAHIVRIHYETERPFIKLYGSRYYFDECLAIR